MDARVKPGHDEGESVFAVAFLSRIFSCAVRRMRDALMRGTLARRMFCPPAPVITRMTHFTAPVVWSARVAPSSYSPRGKKREGAERREARLHFVLRRATGCEPARAAQCALRTRKRAASRRSTCGHFPIPATLFVKRICAPLRQPSSWQALRPGGAPGSLATTADEPPPQGPRRRQHAAPGYLPAAPASPKRAKARSMAPSRLACSIKRRHWLTPSPSKAGGI